MRYSQTFARGLSPRPISCSDFLLREKACRIPRMKTLTALLLIVIAVLSFQVFRQREIIHEQRGRITEIQAQVAATAKATAVPLEYQEKCAEQARKAFHDLGYKSQGPAGYENHYSAKLSKCFVLVENTDSAYAPTIWTRKSLFDAYEGKAYGEYSWHTVKDKKYWEVPPFMCRVTSPAGTNQFCKSDEEYGELIKVYLED